MNKIQLFALMQNQVLEIKTGMKLARNVVGFRASFKRMVGLAKNASNLMVLQEIGRVYKENEIGDEFNEYMIKHEMTSKGICIV